MAHNVPAMMSAKLNSVKRRVPELAELLPALEKSTDVCYAMSGSGELFYCNPAWDRFARDNDGHSCLSLLIFGKNFWNAIPAELESFFRCGFQTAMEQGVWEHDFECPSPTQSRIYRMRVLPLHDGAFLVRNSAVAISPIREKPVDLTCFRDGQGIYYLCSHCRRARRLDASEWTFVPELLHAGRYKVSHGLCPICIRYYYSRELADAVGAE